ncbi:MAG TPA: hypothetical protein VGJ13_11865, partial [Pseudonocardiaceae bacterium]
IGGPEALRQFARWAPDPRGSVQHALVQVWRYFDPGDYAHAVLRDAPLDGGSIKVELFEHIPQLHTLQHLRDANLHLYEIGKVDDLSFLRDAPASTTRLQAQIRGSVDLSPLAHCLALETVIVPSGSQRRIGDTRFSTRARVSPYPTSRWRSGLIENAPLTGGLAAVAPVLDQLTDLFVWSMPTVTSLDVLAGTALEYLNLYDCQIIDLEPWGAMPSLAHVTLRQFPSLTLGPLALLPHLRDLTLTDMDEPVDLYPLAQVDHRLRVELENTRPWVIRVRSSKSGDVEQSSAKGE